MKIMIREGSNAKNMKDLINLIKEGYETFLVSDDILVSDLIKGHLDRLLSYAVELGIDPVKAIKCVTVNPVKHYRIPVGLLRKGDYADLIIVNNLKEFRVIEVYIEGKLVAKDGKATFNVRPKSTGNTLIAKPLELNMIKIRGEGKKQKVNVIGIIPDQIVTDHLIEELETKGGYLESDQEKDILKIIVYERYGHGNLSIGFIKGFGFKNCALASTIAHDSHNIVCAGSSNDLIVKAVNNLIEKGGGVCAVDKSNVEILPLPIAGLMSNEEANIVLKT
jgi:Adenine deaminase